MPLYANWEKTLGLRKTVAKSCVGLIRDGFVSEWRCLSSLATYSNPLFCQALTKSNGKVFLKVFEEGLVSSIYFLSLERLLSRAVVE